MPDATHVPHSSRDLRMPLRSFASRALALAALVAGIACRDATAPDDATERAATDLRLLAAPYGTPPLATTRTSFYAVKGRATGVDIWYRAAPGRSDSSRFLEFRVGAGALDRRPDGSTIADGDSVQITLAVTDPTHFIIELMPSGLRFAAGDQPRLKVSFAACGEDLNYDGRVDGADAAILASLSVWRQEAPFQPWFKMPSTVAPVAREVNTQLGGFTGYALMY